MAASPNEVRIARCPEHGLHGARTRCFICNGPVEQVAMVPASEVERAAREAEIRALTWARDCFNGHDTEDIDALNDAIERGLPQ